MRRLRTEKRERRAEDRPPLLGIIGAASVLTVLFFTPIVLAPAYVQNYYLALVLTGLTVLPLAVRIATRTLDVFEPIIPISLLVGLAFGVRAMYLAYAPVSILPRDVGLLRFDDFIGSALALTIGAYCALLVGYYVIGGAVPIRPVWTRLGHRVWPERPAATRIAILLAIGALATAAIRATAPGEVNSTTNVIGIVAGFTQIAGCILALYIAAGDPRRWLRVTLWLVILPLVAWQSLALGAKSPTLLLLYAVIAARHYVKRRIRLLPLVAAVVIAVLVIFPTVNAFRAPSDTPLSVGSAAPSAGELLARFAAVPGFFAGMTTSEYLQLATESVIGRFTGVDALSLLLRYDVSADLGDPAAYLYIPAYAFVPRLIWPDKPVLEQGTRFGRLLIDPTFQGATWESSFGMFHIGDLYITFGFVGMLIGMCLLGCLYRLVYRFLEPLHAPDPGVRLIYIFLLWMMVSGFEADIPSIYSNVLKSCALWVLIKLWLNARASDDAVGGRRRRAASRGWMPRPGVIHAGIARFGGTRS